MRFLWFHLMPYPDFPPDFKQKHPSVWVDIDPKLFDPVRAHELYNEYMDEMEYAAECGFDAICVNEHHANGYGLMPSPNLIATALARRTSDAAICVLGSSLALYDPPTRVAEEFAMIDCISGGRLIAGLPVGTPMDTCFVGPWIVTRDEIGDPHALAMEARINGERWGGGNSKDMHHGFDKIIAFISQSETLHPGEVIASGTVPTGCGLELGRFLAPGDVIELEIERIGVLRNRIVRPA